MCLGDGAHDYLFLLAVFIRLAPFPFPDARGQVVVDVADALFARIAVRVLLAGGRNVKALFSVPPRVQTASAFSAVAVSLTLGHLAHPVK